MSSSYLLALVLGLLLVVLTKPALGDYGDKPKTPKPPSVPIYKPPKPPVVPIYKPPAPIYKPPLPPVRPPPKYKPPYGDHPPALEGDDEELHKYGKKRPHPIPYKKPPHPYRPPHKPYYKPPHKPPVSN